MKFDWKKCGEVMPKRSGLYFVRTGNRSNVSIDYYCKELDAFLLLDFDCLCAFYWKPYKYMEWAKMPRFSKSKLLHDGCIKIEDL